MPDIYTTWSLENTHIQGYSGACHAGFEDITNCVEFMIAIETFSEDIIKVYGQRGGQYTLPNWQRKISDHENHARSDISNGDGSASIGLVAKIPQLLSVSH